MLCLISSDWVESETEILGIQRSAVEAFSVLNLADGTDSLPWNVGQ